eukprot:7267-Heterococcus_DN1.PRE.4
MAQTWAEADIFANISMRYTLGLPLYSVLRDNGAIKGSAVLAAGSLCLLWQCAGPQQREAQYENSSSTACC